MTPLQQNARLSQELSDIVIDFLHSNKKALKACSLVCRAWTPSSHLHLFHRIDIGVPAFSTKFLQLLRSSTTVPKSIRVLRVYLPKEVTGDSRTIQHNCALSVLERLPALHTLVLYVAFVNPDGVDPVRWRHPSLRYLQFEFFCTTRQAMQTCSFFSLVPVDHLAISVHFMIDQADADVLKHIPMSFSGGDGFKDWPVKTVALDAVANYFYSPACVYLQIFQHGLARDTLTSFATSFNVGAGLTMQLFREFIRTVGRRLVYLQFDASCIYTPLLQDWTFLQSCEKLETLNLLLGLFSSLEYNDDNAGEAHPVRHALSSYPTSILEHTSPTLRRLILGFSPETPWGTAFTSWAANVRWADLEQALLGFPAIQGVDFRLEMPDRQFCIPLQPEEQRAIMEHLPQLHAVQKLRLQC